MPPLRALGTVLAPAARARVPTRPPSPRQGSRASPPCPRGPDGPRRSPGPNGRGPHRVPPACGHRHGPPCPQPTPPPWLPHPLAPPRPGPPGRLPCTGPATRRPVRRAPHRRADQALWQAAATARPRLAHDERCLGTDLPGCTGGLPPWGRHLPSHPPLHALVPGGGLAADRTTWRPARAHGVGPVNALAPLSRALWHAARRHAGRLEHLTPQGWTIPGHVPRQATHHGHAALTSRAVSVARTAWAPSPPVHLRGHAHAPPPLTSWRCAAGSSTTCALTTACPSAPAACARHAVPSLPLPAAGGSRQPRPRPSSGAQRVAHRGACQRLRENVGQLAM